MVFEQLSLKFNGKDIPLPTKEQYLKKLILQTEKFIKNIRWKVFWYEKRGEDNEEDQEKENKFKGILKSTRTPPGNDLLKPFERDMYHLISNIQFREVQDPTLQEMGKEAKSIRQRTDIIINADKTQNRYGLCTTDYRRLLTNNVTKDYKVDRSDNLTNINKDIGKHARKLHLEDRMEEHSQSSAFLTIKDHKADFQNNPKCRLINPSSNQLGKASKVILESAIKEIKKKTGLNQWISTGQLLKWFERRHKSNKNPRKATLIQFDICEFYPSISEELMEKALTFAKDYTDLPDEHLQIIKSCRRSVLFNEGRVWSKIGKDFDITMGALDGAEAADLVGIYLLHQVQDLLDSDYSGCNSGLYRDDGLIYVDRGNGPMITRITKDLHHLFKENGMKISVEQVGKTVNILDVTISSETGTYRPFRKPNSSTTYVNKSSNHPKSILNNIPGMIARRLSSISSSEKEFNEAKGMYQHALDSAGYTSTISYVKPDTRKKRKNRRKEKIWYNPPFSKNVSTKIGKEFFDLLRLHFPPQHPLHNLINRRTVSMSYATMMNMDGIVRAHNKALMRKEEEKTGQDMNNNCNCRKKEDCPVKNKCLTEGVVYKATVNFGTNLQESRQYVGMTGSTFKSRLTTHKTTFRHERYRTETELSKFIWSLKDRDIRHNVTWDITDRAHTYKPGNITCNLCLAEKLQILTNKNLLNKKSELLNKCPHRRKYLAAKMC